VGPAVNRCAMPDDDDELQKPDEGKRLKKTSFRSLKPRANRGKVRGKRKRKPAIWNYRDRRLRNLSNEALPMESRRNDKLKRKEVRGKCYRKGGKASPERNKSSPEVGI